MKRLLIKSFFCAAAASAVTSAYAIPLLLQLQTARDFYATSLGTEIYVAYTVPINSRYTLVPDIANTVNYISGKAGKLSFEHESVRLTLKDTGVAAKFNDNWSFGMVYRYVLPTSLGLQRAGTLGVIAFRPELNGKYGAFSTTIREVLGIPLNRNSYAVSVNPNPTPEEQEAEKTNGTQPGNTLLNQTVEFIFGYDVGAGFSLSLELVPTFLLKGAAKGQSGTSWHGKFAHTLELGYSNDALPGIAFAFGVQNAEIPLTSKFSLYGGSKSAYYFTVAKTF